MNIKNSKVGEKKVIRCPNCDGSGKHVDEQNPQEITTCPDCGGNGKIDGIVVRN